MIEPGHRGRWWLLVALALGVSLVEMVGALLVYVLLAVLADPDGPIELPVIGDVRDIVGDVDQSTLFLGLIISMGVFFLFRGVVKVSSKYAQHRVAHNAGARVANRLAEGYLFMPYAAHLHRNSAELIRNTTQAVDNIVSGIYIPTIRVVAESLLLVGMLAVLLAVTPAATLLAIVVVGGAAALLLLVVQPKLRRIGRAAHELSKDAFKTLQQSLHGIRDVKVLDRERYFAKEFSRNRMGYARARYQRATVITLPTVVIETALIGFILLFFGFVVISGGDLQSVLATLGLFAYAGLRLQPSLQLIVSGLNEIKHATAPLDDLYADLTELSTIDRPTREAEPLPFRQALTLDNVTFRYDGADLPALRDVSLTIRPGEQVGICGPTGGGKTTLVDLMTGLLEPTTGQVIVDGLDLQGNVRAWQRNLAVVPQAVFLTDDTLRRNVALGVPDQRVDEEALEEAIDLAQLSEFVSSLPHGLDTTVGESGVRLSGGQRQRVAIARSLYRRSSVLIFDEGTSALDNATEASLMEAIEGLRGQYTIILVAHRLTTVRKCDKVLFVEDGLIAGVGTFDDLEEENENFRRLAFVARTP